MTIRLGFIVLFALVGIIGTTIVTGSRADPLAPPGIDDSEWRFTLTPYAFIPVSVSGDSTVADTSVSFDLDLSDALDILEFAAAGRFEAWKGDYAVVLDAYYVDLELGSTVTVPGPLGLSGSVYVDIRQFYQDVMGSYRAIKAPYGANGDFWTLEVMGGVRYNYLKQEINVSIGGLSTTLGGSETWFDPMLSLRVSAMLGERWTVSVLGDDRRLWPLRHGSNLVAYSGRRLSSMGTDLAEVRLAVILDRLCDNPQRWRLRVGYRHVRSVSRRHVQFPIASTIAAGTCS